MIKGKGHVDYYTPISMTRKGNTKEYKFKTILGRTNLDFLLKAIEYVTEKKDKAPQFEVLLHTPTND